MADIALVTASVRAIVPGNTEFFNGTAKVAITKGDILFINTDGKLDLADASAAGTAQAIGVATETVGAEGALSVIKRGLVAGFTVSSLNGGVEIFLSDTAKKLADAAGTVDNPVGRVVVMNDAPDLTKVIYFDFQFITQFT